MVAVDLNEYLTRPECPSCKENRTRPVDTYSEHAVFECSGRCGWRGSASLPSIQKKIVYLDTSTVSHMARALGRKETSGPWVQLHETLRNAVADEVICCPSSSILEEEGELSKYGSEILR